MTAAVGWWGKTCEGQNEGEGQGFLKNLGRGEVASDRGAEEEARGISARGASDETSNGPGGWVDDGWMDWKDQLTLNGAAVDHDVRGVRALHVILKCDVGRGREVIDDVAVG